LKSTDKWLRARINQDVHHAFKTICLNQRMTMEDQVEVLIIKYIKEHNRLTESSKFVESTLIEQKPDELNQ
jgi:antitoxin component of RelBE/YafQ-DinJ toxin-antitoxin module